jgi:prolyl oligopeptidase
VWTRHAISEITTHDLASGRQIGTVALPGLGMVENLTAPPHGGAEAWFRYSDHAIPPVVLRFDARTGETAAWPETDLPTPDHDVHSRQVEFTAQDGTTVRMFVLSRTGRPDRPRPAILTGYGGFGISMSPSHMPHAIAWVRAGGVYAIACLRGGGEEGRQWHEAGRGVRKQTVFDDFTAAADLLIGAGWTTRDRLGITGTSNGGLLVGAALTQHPERFAAAVSVSALLDMVRYERSGHGPSWRAEYGSAEVPEELRVLLSYSPYHQVKQGTSYPPTLLTVADGDTRVDPAHARKMCAALQHASSAAPTQAPVLLRIDRGVGHGSRALAKAIDLLADVTAFFGHHLGLSPDRVEAS